MYTSFNLTIAAVLIISSLVFTFYKLTKTRKKFNELKKRMKEKEK